MTRPVTHPVPLRGIFTISWGLRPIVSDITHTPVTHIPPLPLIEILTGSERRLDEF